MGTYEEMMRAARAAVPEMSLADAKQRWESKTATFVDIREPEEISLGAIPGSIVVHQTKIMTAPEESLPDTEANFVVYCASGNRSAFAALALIDKGYKNVWSLGDGIVGWVDNGLPIDR